MTTKPTHTPTHNSYTKRITEKPLEMVYVGSAEPCRPAIIKGSCLEICVSRAEDFGNPEADAAFIVRAVNAHGDLLDTLRFVRQTVHQAHHEGPIEGCRKNTCDAVAQAIAKAEAQ